MSKLANANLLIRTVDGHQVYYQANPSFPVFAELASILRKTSGLVDVLLDSLSSVAEKIDVAFVFCSVGRGTENLGSDVDVLIIGEISFIEAVTALHSAQTMLSREINPKVYQKKEWKNLVKTKNPFVNQAIIKQ